MIHRQAVPWGRWSVVPCWNRRRSWALAVTTCWIVIVAVIFLGCDSGSRKNEGVGPAANQAIGKQDPIEQLHRAVATGDWQSAEEHARQALILRPDDADVVTQAARVRAMRQDKHQAALLLVRAATLSQYEAPRVDFAVHALIDVGELYLAIELLQQAVAARPDDANQRIKLLGFLKEAQLDQLIEPHYQQLIRDRQFDLEILVSFTDIPNRRYSAPVTQLMIERNPTDLRVRLGEARHHMARKIPSTAVEILEGILAQHHDFAPAHALLGQALTSLDRFDELPQWFTRTPLDSDSYVEYWLTLGDWAANQQRHDWAVRAYWEATRRDVNDSAAWAKLMLSAQQLRETDSELAMSVTDEHLEHMHRRLNELLLLRKHYSSFEWGGHESQNHATEIARSLWKLGRNWEAEAWAAVATTLKADPANDLAALRAAIIDDLKRDTNWVSTNAYPELVMDLSHVPLPVIRESSAVVRNRLRVKKVTHDHLTLREASGEWGLDGIGANNDPSNPRESPLARSLGVGGGAIDFDLDGRVDALVMGAGGTILQHDSFPNELLRNLGTTFVTVTGQAGVGMTDYGQGLSVGDFNEDGFADLFFANLGANRLLRNNGDGTFTDCSDLLEGSAIEEWTTCGAFIDLNADGITDLVTANYCDLAGHPEKPCPNASGELGPCHPLRFSAQANRFFLASGDGRFRDVTSQWPATTSVGRSLGIVAGMLAEETLGILIANDMSPNELYMWRRGSDQPVVECAALRGLAVDGTTRSQASMGIASSDFDLDGDLDFYITGFHEEYNIYYEQVADGFWQDRSSAVGVIEPTLPMVGFGTAAIDLDGDGIDEMVVTNGHIGDFPDDESEHEQPFQVFRRDASEKFVLVDDDHWGDYFATPHVGRALWTLDADGDRRSDIMITHTKEQVRLLLNDTQDTSHRIEFKLVGRECSRDAVGAVLSFVCAGQRRTLWSLSGDGFMCSSEKVLRAGLGSSDRIEQVTVRWPDGAVDEVGTLSADASYLIVQGDQSAFPL